MQNDKTNECPVCGQWFNSFVIDSHANKCLNSLSQTKTDSEVATGIAVKRKSNSNGWDFLTRNRTSNKPHSSKFDKANANNDTKTSGCPPSKRQKSTEKTPATSSFRGDTDAYSNSSDVEFIEIEDASLSSVKTRDNTDGSGGNETKERFLSNSPSKNRFLAKMNMVKDRSSSPGSVALSKSGGLQNKKRQNSNAPLAERVRPQTFEEYIGQKKAVGKSSLLHSLLQRTSTVPSMILWGPPGCGKTTLAKVIAHKSQQCQTSRFVSYSATSASVNDVKELAKTAKNDVKMLKRKTILFLDEIHRFNKLQQDALLPHVEDGTITLIGATTENPSFHVNGALLSRCRVITLEKLQMEEIKSILVRAASKMGVKVKGAKQSGSEVDGESDSEAKDDTEDTDDLNGEDSPLTVSIEEEALDVLAGFVDGDARTALNGLQMAVEGKQAETDQSAGRCLLVTVDNVKEGLQRSHVLYDRNGEEHFNIASALIKSMRGSDANAALYWMTRMLEGGENPLFVARRLVVFASEDVGLADPTALSQAVATYQACHLIGMPECGINLAQCVVYLSRAPKSVETYMAYKAAQKCIQQHEGSLPSVPLHLRNASTKLMKSMGYGKGYKFPPAFDGPVDQDYLPECIKRTDFFLKQSGPS